jgi:1,4-dihydroxy-2-naphthoyl-CoA synthase
VLDRARLRPGGGGRVVDVPAGVRPDRADARRWVELHGGCLDRQSPRDADEAYDAGRVSHLADHDAFQVVVADVVARLAAGAPLAQAATKRAVNAAAYAGLDAALERERTGQTLLLRTSDAAEGMRAFAERRAPDFEGE